MSRDIQSDELTGGAKGRLFVGLAVLLVLSFFVTLYALDWLAPNRAPTAAQSEVGSPITSGTALGDVPKLTTPGLSWYAIGGLSAQVVPGPPTVGGSTITRLIAIPTNERHSIAAHAVGLQKGRVYRITAWVRPVSGGNFRIEAGDHAANGGSYGTGVFDLVNHNVGGTAKPGSAPGPENWQRVWIELPTSNGELFFNLDVLSGGQNIYQGDGKLGVLLGAISLDPQG